jgi:hypothetical protein
MRTYFQCTQCRKRCTKTGESATTFGSPPSPDHVVYKCKDHGYHVLDVERNLRYFEGGLPHCDFEHIKSKMNIEWKWIKE